MPPKTKTKLGANNWIAIVLLAFSGQIAWVIENAWFNTYVNDVNEFLKLGDKVKVRVLAVTPDGKINLSIKKAEPAPERPNNRPMHGGRPGGSRPNHNGGAPRAARPNNRSAQPAGQVSGPSGDAAFEDRLKQFMQESDSRMAGNRLYSDRTRGRRRGSGRG